MNTELLLKIAVIVFFTCAFGMFAYYLIAYAGGFGGLFSSVKAFFLRAKSSEENRFAERKTLNINEEGDYDDHEEYEPRVSFFQKLSGFFSEMFVEFLETREEERQKRALGISPKQVIALREQRKGFTGIYIIYNYTKDMYYVGQGQNVYVRCSNHFLAKGNHEIYADYKYGDEFFIQFISLVESGYDNLDDLERYYINRYDAYRHGYNKTKGNRR